MDDQSQNLILATALSFLVILGWFFLFPPEQPQTGRRRPRPPSRAGPRACPARAPATRDARALGPERRSRSTRRWR